MLTGRVAFPAPTEYARLAAVLSATPEPITSTDPQLALIVPFFEKALQKDRARRFQSAIEMSVALDEYAPDPPTLAPNRQSFVGDAVRQSFVSPLAAKPSEWTLSTERVSLPSEVAALNAPGTTKASSGVTIKVEEGEVLVAQVDVSGHSSTLASPNRDSRSASQAPPPVVIVPDEELADARNRAEGGGVPMTGFSGKLLGLLVTLAFGLGILVGNMLAHHHP
jgi:hypothetical protein